MGNSGQNFDWLGLERLSSLTGKSYHACIKDYQRGKFTVVRHVESRGYGGKRPLIHITDPAISPEAQVKWVIENVDAAINLPEAIVNKLSPQAQLEIVKLKAPKEKVGFEVFEKCIDSINEELELINKALNPPKDYKKSKWIEYLAKNEGITKQALYKKLRRYKEKGIIGVKQRDNKQLKKWSSEAVSFMQGVYLKFIKEGGNGSKKRAYEATIAEAEKRGWGVGSESSAYMHLSKINPLYVRYAAGDIKALDNVFYIVRRYDDLEPLECIVGDQHRFDFWVEDKETGRVFRPEGYFWIDLRTRLCYGFSLADRYNAYLMGIALRMGLKLYGKFKTAYTDNGKPETSKFFSEIIKELNLFGMNEQDISELYRTDSGYVVESEEGETIEVVETKQAWHRYARPYNAKAKPIERFFNSLEKIVIDLGTPGLVRELRGTSEEKAHDDKRIKKLKEENKLLSFEEFMLKVFEAVEIYNKRKHYALKSSPLETFLQCVKEGFVPRMVVERELDFILLKREQRSVNRGRVLINGALYEGESLEEGLWDVPDKTKIEVRYDPYETDKVYAIRHDGRIVELREVPISSMKDKEKTSELMKWKREMVNQVRDEYKKLTSQVRGVIEYSTRTKRILENKKKKGKPEQEIVDRESFEKEVAFRVEMTSKINSASETRLKKPGFFASEREKYKYLVDCEMEGLEISEEEKLFMQGYEAKMENGERIWWDNYKRMYQYQRRSYVS